MSAVFLHRWRESQEFPSIMASIKARRPVVPRYYPRSTLDEQQQCIEKLKYDMAKQEGFDLAVDILEGRIPLKEKTHG